MRKRNVDGTFRGARKALRVSQRVRIARWVEAETLRLKRLGLSFDAIAEQITKVGRGEARATVTLPAEVSFQPDYHISRQACCKAFRKAIMREPSLRAEEMRVVDTGRCEDMYLSLQPGMREGDPRSVEAGVRVLAHKAELNGYKAPARVEMAGGTRVNVLFQQQAAADAQELADLNRLTLEELREYRRLEAKARGAPDVVEIEAMKQAPEASDEAAELAKFKTDKSTGE